MQRLKAISQPGELQGDFIARLTQIAHEQRDIAVEKLRKKHAPRVAKLQERIRKAEARVETQKEQYSNAKLRTVMSFGTTLVGALMGRKAMSVTNASRASTAMNRASRAGQEKADVERAEATVDALEQEMVELEERFQEAVEDLKLKYNPDELETTETLVRPRKSDISIQPLIIAWTPWIVDRDGIAEKAF